MEPQTSSADKETRDVGRPSIFTDEVGLVICERLADGESLRTIGCDPEMPSQRTIYRWLAANEEFRQQYARARETQADTLFDEILDIADDGSNDWMERHDDQGGNIGWKENGEAMQRSRLRVDARKWMAGKLRPKKYGEKIDVEHSVGDGFAELLAARRAAVAALNANG
jgi:hypothetical protein